LQVGSSIRQIVARLRIFSPAIGDKRKKRGFDGNILKKAFRDDGLTAKVPPDNCQIRWPKRENWYAFSNGGNFLIVIRISKTSIR
jgi:hypothetical protein